MTLAAGSRFAFALAEQPTTALYTTLLGEQFNSGGSPIKSSRAAVGVYFAQFPNLGRQAGQPPEVVFAAPALSPGGANNCQVDGWSSNSVDPTWLDARVRCFSAAGSAIDTRYVVQAVEAGSLAGRLGFVMADQPTVAEYPANPTYAANSAGGAVTITRAGPGNYLVRWAGLARQVGQPPETVVAVAHGNVPRHCSSAGWSYVAGDLVAGVTCFNMAGTPTDGQFVAMLADRGRAGRRWAVVLADQANVPLTTPYTPNVDFSRSSSSGAISIMRTAAGTYRVTLRGMAGTSPMTTMVTPFGSAALCRPLSWRNVSPDWQVDVGCISTSTGVPVAANTQFSLLVLE